MDSQPIRIRARVLRITVMLMVTVGCAGRRYTAASSLPLTNAGQDVLADTTGLSGFRNPAYMDEQPRLVMLEEYQSGKIPIVFIHGLMASPATWKDMLTACYSDEDINAGCQFWVFHYPTGVSYIESAKQLRRQLAALRGRIDPDQHDPALSQIVLVGHSMGGLVAKLQVTDSDDRLWQAVANGPFDQLDCDEETWLEIRDALFFTPSPYVSRVVYIGTPHGGSNWTGRPIGRLGNRLVKFSKDAVEQLQHVRRNNESLLKQDAVSSNPTSLRHLAPDHPILLATTELTVSPAVRQHSIIGIHRTLIGKKRGDGVVRLASARLPGVDTEDFVEANHTHLNRHAQTEQVVRQILIGHLRACRSAGLPAKQSEVDPDNRS